MNKNNHSTDRKTRAGMGAQIDNTKQGAIPHHKRIAGSIAGMVAVVVDQGRTIIYVDPVRKDPEGVRREYEKRHPLINH